MRNEEWDEIVRIGVDAHIGPPYREHICPPVCVRSKQKSSYYTIIFIS